MTIATTSIAGIALLAIGTTLALTWVTRQIKRERSRADIESNRHTRSGHNAERPRGDGMKALTKNEARTLTALVAENAESPRPVRTEVVQAACNTRCGVERDMVLPDLTRLALLSLLEQDGEAWMPTSAGKSALGDGDRKESAADAPAKSNTAKDKVFPPMACVSCGPKQGQSQGPECGVVNAFNAGRIAGEEAPMPAAVRLGDEVKASRPTRAGAQGIPIKLLWRCAPMQVRLLSDAHRRYTAGNQGTRTKLFWLIETGEQVVATGGESTTRTMKGGLRARRAVMHCGNPRFCLYLEDRRRHKHGLALEELPDRTHTVDDAAEFIRASWEVERRAEIDHCEEARAMLNRVMSAYQYGERQQRASR